MKIKSFHFGVGVIIVAVLLVSVVALAQPKLFYQNLSADCTIDLYGYGQTSVCSDILNVSSGAPGTLVTVSLSDFSIAPADGVTYNYPPNMPPSIQYFIYFERAQPFGDVEAASGNLACDTLTCTDVSRAATFLRSGYFSDTFAVPNVSPGTYNVILAMTYAPPIPADYFNATSPYVGTFFGMRAATTFTVT